MPYAKFDNLNLYYEVEGTGEPIIFINGLKTDHTRWAKVRDLLKSRFKVIVFDNRATGRTQDDGHNFTIKTMAEDTKALMNYLAINTAYIVGHSMGGAVAQTLAYHYPAAVKKLFLLNTFIQLNDAAKAGFHEILQLHENGSNPQIIMQAMLPWGFSIDFLTPELERIILQASLNNPYPQNTVDYRRQYNALIDFDSRNWLSDIAVPTCIIYSEKDNTALPKEAKMLASLMNNAKLFSLPGGHASAIEQPDGLAAIIDSNIASQTNIQY